MLLQKAEQIKISHDHGHGIPFDIALKPLQYMQYGSAVRVMFEMQFITGCRMSALDCMTREKIIGNQIYFKVGKNQKSQWTHEELPVWFIREIDYYRMHHRVYLEKLFGIKSSVYRRYFNKFIRPQISEWNVMRLAGKQGDLGLEYRYQLKGLRKNFWTHDFNQRLKKYDPNVALQATCKRARHSSERITAYHYIEEDIGSEKYINLTPAEIIKQNQQKRLFDYLFVPS